MWRILLLSILIVPASASADAYKCESLKWGDDEEELEQLLNEQSSQGWSVFSFPKPGTACFAQQSPAATYECHRVKWRSPEELGEQLANLVSQGLAPVTFPKPGTVCVRLMNAAAKPRPTAGPTTSPPPSEPKKAAPGGATTKGPKEDVRDRANKLHEELKALEAQYAAGQISKDEYDKRKKELEAAPQQP